MSPESATNVLCHLGLSGLRLLVSLGGGGWSQASRPFLPEWSLRVPYLCMFGFVQGRSFCSDPKDTRRKQTPARLHEVLWPHGPERPGSSGGLTRPKRSHSTGAHVHLQKSTFPNRSHGPGRVRISLSPQSWSARSVPAAQSTLPPQPVTLEGPSENMRLCRAQVRRGNGGSEEDMAATCPQQIWEEPGERGPGRADAWVLELVQAALRVKGGGGWQEAQYSPPLHAEGMGS